MVSENGNLERARDWFGYSKGSSEIVTKELIGHPLGGCFISPSHIFVSNAMRRDSRFHGNDEIGIRHHIS